MDEWVAAALSNDSLVADLLSRLTQSPSHPPPFIRLPCAWGHRQRRSKPAKDSGTRRSPTTPLSWSGASEGGDCSNCTSSRPPSDLSRSNKGAYGDDVTNNKASASASSKRKKSFAELKEEERLLLEERVGLKREVASLNSSLKQQRAAGERLRRIKIELDPRKQDAIFFALPDLNMMPSDQEMLQYR